jgi:MoaA/NifB/PqqE/SkfB family radical SAM enzyme
MGMRDLFKSTLRTIGLEESILVALRRYRFKQMAQAAVTHKLPELVAVELTNECNLRCAKCPTYEAKRAKGLMSKDLYLKIIRDIERAGDPVSLGLSGAGESLLHPDLVEFIEVARRVKNIYQVGFATNGLNLVPELSQGLLDAGIQRLKASLDFTDRDSYRKINKVDGYEQVVRNFQEFCKLR